MLHSVINNEHECIITNWKQLPRSGENANMPLQRTLVGNVDVTYRSHMSLDPGVSGDVVKVTNHEALSAGFTPISRPFLVYQIYVRIQYIFRGKRERTRRTRKSPVIMLRLDVMPQVAPPIEQCPTLYTRVSMTLIFVATSFAVWIANTRTNISRDRRTFLALINICPPGCTVSSNVCFFKYKLLNYN